MSIMLRALFFFLFLSLHAFSLQAQIEVVDATVPPYSPENLITNYFLGEGIKVTSVKYEGSANGVGFFNKAGNAIGIQKGIILTNGFAASTGTGANRKFGADAYGIQIASNDNKVNPVDQDINAILKLQAAGSQKSTNLSKYTISFIPSADTLRFRYVFASEEYPEFICDRYNDVFGFFISGPGINGPYENNGVNIALIPGTSLPVTINNINLGKGTVNCPPKYSQFYNNNDQTSNEPVYDGFLDVFTAQAIVQPCQEYTIKLIVADVGDASYDSGVFLEAKSFGTGSVEVEKVTLAQDDFVMEGCGEGSITFKIPRKANRDIPINCKIIGSAINGVDYKRIPTNFFVPEGDSLLLVKISALEDNFQEGTESIGFIIEKDVCTRDTFWFYINESTFFASPRIKLSDTLICKGKEVKLDAAVKMAIPEGKKFGNTSSGPVSTVLPNSGVSPTILPILVSNVSPIQFSPNIIESVCVNIQHPWIDDIDLYLVAPNGQFIALSTDNGGSGDNYTNTCFRPGAKINITNGVAPFTGEWLPEEPFENLLLSNGVSPVNGIWKLMVIDDQPGLDGVFINWSISFKSNYKIDYLWSNTQYLSCQDCAAVTLSPPESAEKTVVITDVYGCQIKDKIKIVVEDSLKVPEVLCGVTTHNSVLFSWNSDPKIKGYEIRLNNGSWQNINDSLSFQVSNLSPGILSTLQVRGTGGNCFARMATKVCSTIPCTTVLPELIDLKPLSCYGRSDGSVKIGVKQGGIAPFSYSIGTISNDTGIFEGLSNGKYIVSINDAFTCAAKIEFEITEPGKMGLKTTVDSLKCYGDLDAKATLKVEGGSPPYVFKWSNGSTFWQNMSLSAGKYQVTVVDKNNCIAIDSIILSEPRPIRYTSKSVPATCNNGKDGTASIEIINGGTAPFEYLWKSKTYLQPGFKVVGLDVGTYLFTITDANGCMVSDSVLVEKVPEVKIKPVINGLKCTGDQNGQIYLVPIAGSPPFKYDWSNGKSGEFLSGLSAGTYQVSVTDKFNCQSVDSFIIPQLPSLKTISKQISDNKCAGGSDGFCRVIVDGGSGNLSYQWSTGQQGETLTNLRAGKYYVTVSDANSCVHIDSILVNQPERIQLDSKITDVSCASGNTGAITIIVFGGIPPYQFKWSTGDTVSELTRVAEGNYRLTVTDFNGCSEVGSYLIKSTNDLKAVAKVSHQKCFKTASGGIEIEVSGGSPPYTYFWQTGEISKNLIDINPGIYQMTITDVNGCTLIDRIEVLPADSIGLKIAINPVKCASTKTATVLLDADGGNPPFLYSFNGSTYSTVNKFENLAAGLYAVSVRDNFNCITEKEIEIFDKKPMQLKIPNDSQINFGDTLVAALNIINNQGAIKVEWIPGSLDVISCDTCMTARLYPKVGTFFQVRVRDSVGCEQYKSFFLKVVRKNEIIVPTGFSPNNDGENDNLSVFGTKGTKVIKFEIFDKWGEEVFNLSDFQVNDAYVGWDGNFNGISMPSGVYIWKCTVKFPDGSVRKEKGLVTLLR